MTQRHLLPALLALALLAAACAPQPVRRPPTENPAWALAEQPPDDFTLAVTVYAPSRSAAATPLPRYLRSARYIVQPDRSFRAREGRSTPRTYPDLTRILTTDEVQRLWWDLRDAGLLRRPHPARAESPESAAPDPADPPSRGLYVITCHAHGRQTTLALDPLAGDDAPAARRLVDRLANLAWFK